MTVPSGTANRRKCRDAYFPTASATARRAITPIRCARYSALPWISLLRPVGGNRQPFQRLRRKPLLQRFLERGDAEYAVAARAGDRNADFAAAFADEHADQRIARRLIAEFLIGGLFRNRKAHLGDDLRGLKHGREHPGKEIIGLDAALVGDDGGAEPKTGGGIVGGRIVVGDRTADRAHVAHCRIADHAGKLGEHRQRLLNDRRGMHVDVPRHRADGHRAAARLNSGQGLRCAIDR